MSSAERELQRIVQGRWPDRQVIQARVLGQRLRHAPLPLLQAEATGRLTLRPDSVVRSLSADTVGGKATGVEFVDRVSKRGERVHGRLVFLCASAFESVRLLLNSRSSRHPEGIGGGSGVLGRYIADHVFLKSNGPLTAHAAAGATARRQRDPYDFADAQGFYIPSFRNIAVPHREFVRGYGLCGGVGRVGPSWWMGAFGEMLMRAENRITLDPIRRDAWGVPAAHIECAWGPNDRALIADALRAMEEILDAAGLVRSRAASSPLEALVGRRSFAGDVAHPGLAIHELGGARMGAEPAASVVDPLCRCWDAQNVVVSDGSCFVSGGYQNPALTIMALTVRAAERAVADFERIAC